MLTSTYMSRPYENRKSRKIVKRDDLTNFGIRNKKAKHLCLSDLKYILSMCGPNVVSRCLYDNRETDIITKTSTSPPKKKPRPKFSLFNIDINVLMYNGQRRTPSNDNNTYDIL